MPIDNIIGELTESELRELVPQLQNLTQKYKRSERIQKALYNISELSSSLDNFDSLYAEIHNIVSGFMMADNFFVAFNEAHEERIRFAYFVDENDEETIQTMSYEKIKNGITAHILRSGENLVLTKENIAQMQAKHNFEMLGSSPTDMIGVPIIRDNQVIGAMVVQSYTDNVRYDADDLEILVFISQHIVTARDRIIHRDLTESIIAERTEQLVKANRTLEDEITERMRMEQLQKALFEISELSTNLDGDIVDFYAKLHLILKQLINAENCYIALLDSENESLSFPYFVGRDEDFYCTRKLTQGLTEYVIRSKDAVLIDSVKINELVESKEVERKFVIRMIVDGNSWMGAPLKVDSRVKGVMAVQTYGCGDDYDEADLDILRFVSQHVSVAMERRQAANELIIYNQQLSEKVKERTAELHQTNTSLKKQIEQRKEVELKLIHDAHHDGLTNLPNRVMFNSRLELAIASKQRYSEHNFALLFIDLDRFKSINDTLGHQAGDEFLIEASNRISACKRSHDLLARLGGDEFVILVDKFNTLSDVETIAQRIVDSVSSVFNIEEKEVFSGASIGVAEITSEYTSADDVLRDADAAMYQAKNLGRNRYVIFDISMRNQLIGEIDDERKFRQAFKLGHFNYALQRIKDLHDNSVLYYECTINWPQHPKCNSTESFWALADKCSLTYEINRQLIEEAFSVLRSWRLDAEHNNTKIGFSLSVEHLLNKSSFEDLLQQIQMSKVNPELIVIELSESALARFPKYLPDMFHKLQALGVTVVLDSFGSHSGSLNQLFKYDFDFIKLDQNLVNTFGMSDKYHRIVKSIVLVANEMNIGVIADGVNDEITIHELNEIGCHFGQGNAIATASSLTKASRTPISS
jgi:diguanylate cyclase (GGDEF)-like protein